MKILQINITYGVGSTGKIVQDIHNHLISRGIDSSVIYGRSQKIKQSNIYFIGSKLSFYIDVILTRITGLVGFFSIVPTIKMIRHIVKVKPDIIHLHNIHGYYLNIPILFSFLIKYKHKIVLTLHDEFFFTGKCAHSKQCKKFEIECHDCPLVKDYPKSLGVDFTRFMYRAKKRWFEQLNIVKVVSPSIWLETKLKRSILNLYPSLVINNGIDTSVFQYTNSNDYPSPIGKEKFIVLSVISKLDDTNKGFHIVRRIAEESIGSDLVFVVIGFKKNAVNLPENIIIIPRVENQHQLADYYLSSDLYLMVSEIETYPTVTLEASAASLPILAYDAGGTRETIIGVQGKVIPYNSPDTLNEIYKFKAIIQSNKYKKSINDKLNTIDRSNMINGYVSLYQGAVL